MYDYIIIGAGISGLYMGMQLKKLGKKFIILERNTKVGGRTQMIRFAGKWVVGGAGVCRYNDKNLISLMELFNIPIKWYDYKVNYPPNFTPIDIKQRLSDLRQYITPQIRSTTTFKDAYIQKFGYEDYERFKLTVGFTDYENADIIDTIDNYGFEDNLTNGTRKSPVDWRKLITCMYKLIKKHVVCDVNIVKVKVKEHKCVCMDSNDNEYTSKNIIFATEKTGLKLYKNNEYKRLIYNNISGQSFLRAYIKAKFKCFDRSCEDFKTTTDYVPNALQKVMPYENDIYMISYSDNKNADDVMKLMNNENPEKKIQKILPYSTKIKKSKYIHWKIGTHYYKPLGLEWPSRDAFRKYAMHPQPSVYVVGEIVSNNQGWCEGGLETVNGCLRSINM